MNRRGEKPDTLEGTRASVVSEVGYQNVVGHDDVTRFDRKRNNNKRERRDNNNKRERRPNKNNKQQ